MDWEIERGVLNPVEYPLKPGSPWWRAVNLHFCYLSTLAMLAHNAHMGTEEWEVPVRFWLEYITNPSGPGWYRAHNSSIIDGYLTYQELARNEVPSELPFINMVLYRLLYAQAMIEGDSDFQDLGRILANPLLPSVDLIVHIPDFYPDHYPLSHQDVKEIFGKGHDIGDQLVRLLDDTIILPQLGELYRKASLWNQAPDLVKLEKDGVPIYPAA